MVWKKITGNEMIINRIRIIGFVILTLAVIAPDAALADWKIYYTGTIGQYAGYGGRGSFPTRYQCELYRTSQSPGDQSMSYCGGFDTPSQNRSGGDDGSAAREQEKQRQLQLQKEKALELARQKKFAEERDKLVGNFKGGSTDTPGLKTAVGPASACIEKNRACILNGTPCCAPYSCTGKFPNTYCGTPKGTGADTVKGVDDSSAVARPAKKKPDIGSVAVQRGVANPARLVRELLEPLPTVILLRTERPNAQAQLILRSFNMPELPDPVKNIADLSPGDVVLVAPWSLKDRKKAGNWEVGLSNGINLLDKWGSNSLSPPASHAAIFLGERNGKRWYMDNTSSGTVIKEEKYFLKEYGARKMDVATLVGQPLSKHEGDELWKGAHELRNMTTYWPSGVPNVTGSAGMVCSESSRWLLMRAGRRVPETSSENAKIFGKDIGLNKKQFVDFSPSDFYEEEQYFVIHQLDIQGKGQRP